MAIFSRTDTSLISNWWWTIDRLMILCVVMLMIFGIVMTFGASPAVAEHLGLGSFHFVKRQVFFLSLGIILMFLISLLSVPWLRRLGLVLFITAIGLLLLTALVGPEIKGARRWIRLGSFTLQASEFLKPAFIITSAWLFSQATLGHRSYWWGAAIITYIVAVFLLIIQPDFGQSSLITIIWGMQFFMAGLPVIWVMGLAGAALAGVFFAYIFLPHVTSRIDRFIFPESGDTYQVDTAMKAFKSGGLFGKGPGEGAIKKILPDAHTDFIFAVTGEEFGIIMCIVIILLFATIVIRGMVNLLKEKDLFIFLSVAGLLTQFGLQSFINLGVNLSLLPSKGMTLPFISYGGSSLLAISIGLGMILALTRRTPENTLDELNNNWRYR